MDPKTRLIIRQHGRNRFTVYRPSRRRHITDRDRQQLAAVAQHHPQVEPGYYDVCLVSASGVELDHSIEIN